MFNKTSPTFTFPKRPFRKTESMMNLVYRNISSFGKFYLALNKFSLRVKVLNMEALQIAINNNRR